MTKDAYLYDIFDNDFFNFYEKARFFENHLIMREIISKELINHVLSKNDNFFFEKYVNSYLDTSTLFLDICHFHYFKGKRDSIHYTKQMNELLDSNLEYKWTKKDNYILDEILSATKFNISAKKNIIKIIERHQEVNKIETTAYSLLDYCEDPTILSLLLEKKYNFKKNKFNYPLNINSLNMLISKGIHLHPSFLFKFLKTLEDEKNINFELTVSILNKIKISKNKIKYFSYDPQLINRLIENESLSLIKPHLLKIKHYFKRFLNVL